MAGEAQVAFELAVEALGRKERTSAELTTWLRGRGCVEEDVADAISRLTEIGELDDERFARRYAEDKRELRGWGAQRIREALLARGIASSLVEATLEADSHDGQVDRAGALLVERGRSLAGEADRASALAYLVRRGYDYEIAYEAIRLAARRAA
jgi:regulatory protein